MVANHNIIEEEATKELIVKVVATADLDNASIRLFLVFQVLTVFKDLLILKQAMVLITNS